MAVKIVTDSTSDLPAALVRELGITVVPLFVNFGQDSYLDGVDLQAEDFYQKLVQSPMLPTTSQPTPAAFTEVYQKLSRETEEIVSIHISPKLSGTYNSAELGRAAMSGGTRIELIDSLQASMGLGLIVIQAARAAQRGAGLDEVVGITRDVIPRTHFFGVVDTLEYLHKGGRIGKAQALMGTLLSIKPIICCFDGEVHPKGKARTRRKALDQLFEIASEFTDIEEMAVCYSTTPEEAEAFTRRTAGIYEPDRVIGARVGPVIGTYLGPGAIAIGIIDRHSPTS